MKLTQSKKSAFHHVIVYGPPKAGKTQLVGGLAERFNLIWFDCESGWETLLKLPTEYQERIDLITVPDSRVYPIAAETWSKVIRGGEHKICLKHGKVSCPLCSKDPEAEISTVNLSTTTPQNIVVFDSLTQFTDSCISFITKAESEDYKLLQDDWGQLSVRMSRFLSQIQAAQFHIACISHEQEVTMVDKQVAKIVPVAGSSKSSRNMAKYFDTVVYCEVRNKAHKFTSSTTATMNVVAGSRDDTALETLAVPSLLAIFDPEYYYEKYPEARNSSSAKPGAAAQKVTLGTAKPPALPQRVFNPTQGNPANPIKTPANILGGIKSTK